MDFSKMNIQQLLEYLKTASPEMYSTLTNPMRNPGEFSDGELPIQEDSDIFGYKQHLQNTIGRGYDPNLIVENGKSLANPYSDISEQNAILFALQEADPTKREGFPSDSLINKDLSWYGDGPIPGAAAASAYYTFNSLSNEDLLNLLLKQPANSEQIGVPEFTVDDSEPLFNFDPKEMLDDYESGPDAVDRILKRNKNFRWD